jgi:cystathionine gamma-synthase
VLRGLRTLALRMERHSVNAMAVAEALAARHDVVWLRYPGLAAGPHAHPGAATAARQMRMGGADGPAAFGGMVSFVPAPGGRHGRTARERAIAVVEGTRLWTLAESLGGVESLVEMPAVMTHASVAATPLEVPEALIRLSVGIEDAGDLIADLTAALDDA